MESCSDETVMKHDSLWIYWNMTFTQFPLNEFSAVKLCSFYAFDKMNDNILWQFHCWAFTWKIHLNVFTVHTVLDLNVKAGDSFEFSLDQETADQTFLELFIVSHDLVCRGRTRGRSSSNVLWTLMNWWQTCFIFTPACRQSPWRVWEGSESSSVAVCN